MNILLIDSKTPALEQSCELFKQKQCKTVRVNDPLLGLKLLSKHKFEVVVVTNNLVKTTSSQLLKAISIKFPSLIRVAYLDCEELEVKNSAHYLFVAPIDQKRMVATVVSLKKSHKAITKEVIKKNVARVKTLPSPPKVYMQLNSMLQNSNSDSDKIGEIISQDPALSAKVLQFTNNTFAQPNDKPLTNIADAITKMGVDTLSCIVMTAEMFSYQPDIANFSIIDEQLHSLATARFAASLVPAELKQDTLLAGLLHDIGKLVLFEFDKELTAKYFENSSLSCADTELEKKIFSTDHSQVGAYLLHLWGFSYHLIEAILHHHQPKKLLAESIGIAQAVYIANMLLSEQELAPSFVKHFNLSPRLETLKTQALRFK